MNWEVYSDGYGQSNAKQIGENFDSYISKVDNVDRYWLRIYYHEKRIFSTYLSASDINQACKRADKEIVEYLKEEMEMLKLLKRERGV